MNVDQVNSLEFEDNLSSRETEDDDPHFLIKMADNLNLLWKWKMTSIIWKTETIHVMSGSYPKSADKFKLSVAEKENPKCADSQPPTLTSLVAQSFTSSAPGEIASPKCKSDKLKLS